MKKKILAMIMTMCIIISSMYIDIRANEQAPVQSFTATEVYYVVGQSIIDGSPIIKPVVTLQWTDPMNWEAGREPSETHSPDFYQFQVVNKTLNITSEFQVTKTMPEFNSKILELEEYINLETGCLYEISIQPMHYHTNINDIKVLAPTTAQPKKVVVITDPLVTLEAKEDEITVVWDNVGTSDMYYRIVYAVGDYSNRTSAELVRDKAGEINNLSTASSGVTQFYDSNTRRAKLSYTIDSNIYPGQIYSVIVEPTVDYYEGNQITRNRNAQFINTCSTNITLSAYEDGDYVRLTWKIPPSFKVGANQDEYALVEARLVEYASGQTRNIAIFQNSVAASMEYYKVAKPLVETEYQMVLRYEAVSGTGKQPITASSAKILYVPDNLKVTPTQPKVPKPISKDIFGQLKNLHGAAELKALMEEQYMVVGDTFTNSDIINFMNTGRSFTVDKDTNTIQLVFNAFSRKNTELSSESYGEYIIDSNVFYDVYVTKNISDLAGAVPVVEDKRLSEMNECLILDAEGKIIGYRVNLEQYYSADSIGLKDITPNEIYYIKIVASKKWGTEKVSSTPTVVTIYFDYDGNISEPPTVSKPPLEVVVDEITERSIRFAWKESWYEIIARDTAQFPSLSEWVQEVWVDNATGEIYTEAKDNTKYFPIYEREGIAEELRNYLTRSFGITDFNYIQRKVDMGKDLLGQSDVSYELVVLPYAPIKQYIENVQLNNPDYDINEYIETLLRTEKETGIMQDWKKITPIIDATGRYDLIYDSVNLLPNTQYVFMLKPSRVGLDGTVLYAHNPAILIATTDKEIEDINPDPTVPNLYCIDTTEHTITLSWKYNTDLQYEIKYGLLEDISRAVDLPIVLPTDTQSAEYPTNGAYYDIVVDDLFPSTEYYFWIRALNPITQKYSAYSSALLAVTDNIFAPFTATGLGLAAYESIQPYNYTMAQGDTYLIIEWLLHPKDKQGAGEENKKVKTSYSYILEVATNEKFIDAQYIQSTDGTNDILPSNVEKLKKNLLVLNNLAPNKKYYFRIKTKLIVQGSEVGQYLERESAFSPVVILRTKPNGDEYDSEIIDDMIVLQEEFYEVIYDVNTKELKYRFRFDDNDENGEFDNYLVEKLISEIVAENPSEYVLDMSDYKGYAINKRTIEIPYRLWSALNERRMALKLIGDTSTLSVPAAAVAIQMEEQSVKLGQTPKLRICMENTNASYMDSIKPENMVAATQPQQYSMKILTDIANKEVRIVEQPITIALTNNNRFSIYNTPTDTFYYSPSRLAWMKTNAVYDKLNNQMIVQSTILGIYNTYSHAKSTVQEPHWSDSYKETLQSNMGILGLDNKSPEQILTKEDFLKIIYGAVAQQETTNISDKLTDAMKNALLKSNIAPNVYNLTAGIAKQEAIHIAMQAAGKINGETYTASAAALSKLSPSTLSMYRNNVAAALEYGVISINDAVSPNVSLTYADMYSLLAKVFGYK